MDNYIKLFNNSEEQEAFAKSSSFKVPHISVCKDNLKVVKYNPYIEAIVNVSSTSEPTKILNRTNQFKKVIIDGVKQPTITTGYTFDTLGEHTVKYETYNINAVGTSAFTYCNNIKKLVIPNTVIDIYNDSFFNCWGFGSIGPTGSGAALEIPNSVTYLGNYAFYYCFYVTNVVLPDSVKDINTQCFYGCRTLTSVTFGSDTSYIGNSAFTTCQLLHFANFNENSKNLQIGMSAFSGCPLATLDLPSGTTGIGISAFTRCSTLDSITVRATTPPTLNSYAFDYTNNCPIYVPSGSVDTYKAASGWSTYADRIQTIS